MQQETKQSNIVESNTTESIFTQLKGNIEIRPIQNQNTKSNKFTENSSKIKITEVKQKSEVNLSKVKF